MEKYSNFGINLEKFLSLFRINPGDKLYEIINPGWRMNKEEKPKTGIRIYRFGILYETITDWIWYGPEDKICLQGIFKPGWSKVSLFNEKHPILREKSRKLKMEQKKILDRKKLDWKKLNETMIDL